MYFPEPVYDSYSGLNIQTTGCLSLNGTQALQVVRARHLQYKPPGVTTTDPSYWPQEAQSDLARIRRDHEFLRVLASAVKAKAEQSDHRPGADFGCRGRPHRRLELLGLRHDQPRPELPRRQRQQGPPADHAGAGRPVRQLRLPGGSYGDIEFPSEPQDHAAVDQFLGLKTNADTYSGGALPAPSSLTVSVMNGSGAYNQATDTAQSLKALGFNIGTVGDTAAGRPGGRDRRLLLVQGPVRVGRGPSRG